MTDKLLKICLALNSPIRLKIISHLLHEDLNLHELYSKMKNEVKYRQYIHRHLEILAKAGIVKKYYSKKNRSIIKYHLTKEKIIIDLSKM